MLTSILLQGQTGGGSASFIILMVGMLVVFYFFIFRPQQKKQKSQKNFTNEMKRGDQVVTIGGIHGKIFEMNDDSVVLEVEKGGKIRFDKTSISFEASTRTSKK